MVCLTLLRRATLLLATASSVLAALPNIEVRGSDFVDSSTNKRFAIVGVDYQPGGSAAAGTGKGDPLSNPATCLRDAVLMQRLGINTIRSYNVDPTLNHDQCMSIFDMAGIYVILDINTPLSGQYMDRSNPSSTYTTAYLTHIFTVVEAFKGYPNLLALFAANEIINDIGTAQANPPYMRAVQRDLKNYIAKHASRAIPVGYSAADVREVLQDTWAYLQCDNNGDNSRADFFGLNSYSWCGGSATFESSGYNDLVTMFAPTTIPVFFSEYGCNDVKPRVFDEVQALYGAQMTTLSGGMIYEYTQEGTDPTGQFGLVQVNSNASVSLLTDTNNLVGQYNKIDVSLIQSANSTSENQKAPTCTGSLIKASGFSKSFNIPKIPTGGQQLIDNGIKNAPTGALQSVTATSVTQAVYNTNGAQLKNLVLKASNGSNTPSGLTMDESSSSSSSSSSGTSSAASSSSSQAAAATGAVYAGGLAAGVFGVLVAVL